MGNDNTKKNHNNHNNSYDKNNKNQWYEHKVSPILWLYVLFVFTKLETTWEKQRKNDTAQEGRKTKAREGRKTSQDP